MSITPVALVSPSGPITGAIPSSTVGVALVSQGATSIPSFDLVSPGGGGTGVANSHTITIGGNVTFSGAYATTFTVTGTTSVTFPVSGTLATLADITTTLTADDSTSVTGNSLIISGGSTGLTTTTSGASEIKLIGTLGVANGGTGVGSITSGNLVVGAGTSPVTSIAYTPNPTVSTVVSRDSSGNSAFNNVIDGFSSTVSAGQTIALTTASPQVQISTGSTAITFDLPNATTLYLGQSFVFHNNNSAGTLTVKLNDNSTTLTSLTAGGSTTVVCTSISTSNGVWSIYPGLTSTATSSASSTVLPGYLSVPKLELTGGTSGTLNLLPLGSFTSYSLIFPSTVGTSGYFLTSSGSSASAMTWTNPGTVAIKTIDGDTGSVTPTAGVVTLYAHQASNLTGASVAFNNSGTTSLFTLTDSNDNVMLGYEAGNLAASETNCVGIGNRVMQTVVSPATYSIGIGGLSMEFLSSGSYNTAVGSVTLQYIGSGSQNLAMGYLSGSNYTGGESNNILLSSAGVAGENNVMRLGTSGTGAGQVSQAYMAGVYGNTPTSSPQIMIIDSNGTLGSQTGSSSPITLIGDTGTASGTTLTIYSNNAANVSGGSVTFVNSSTTSLLNLSDAQNNTFLGGQCGNNTLISSLCTAVGYGSQIATNGSTQNVSIGDTCLATSVSGNYNTALGSSVFTGLLTGSNNIGIGILSGESYIGAETANILIGHQGVAAESGIIRLGTFGSTSSGQQTNCYIDTIWNNALSLSSPKMVVTDSTGLLGVQPLPVPPVAFNVVMTGSTTSAVTGGGQLYYFGPNAGATVSTAYDNTSSISTDANGTLFTAPIAGLYNLNALFCCDNSDNSQNVYVATFQIVSGINTYYVQAIDVAPENLVSPAFSLYLVCSATVQLSVGDKVYFTCMWNYGNTVITITGNTTPTNRSYFAGNLIGV